MRGTTGTLLQHATAPTVYPIEGREPFLRSAPQLQPLLRTAQRHRATRRCSLRGRRLSMSQLNRNNPHSPSSRDRDTAPRRTREGEARRAFLSCSRRPPQGRGAPAPPSGLLSAGRTRRCRRAKSPLAPAPRRGEVTMATPPDSPHSAEYCSAHSPAEAQPPTGPWRCRRSSCFSTDKGGYCSVKASAAWAKASRASGTHSPLTTPRPPAGAIFPGRMRSASAWAGGHRPRPSCGTGGGARRPLGNGVPRRCGSADGGRREPQLPRCTAARARPGAAPGRGSQAVRSADRPGRAVARNGGARCLPLHRVQPGGGGAVQGLPARSAPHLHLRESGRRRPGSGRERRQGSECEAVASAGGGGVWHVVARPPARGRRCPAREAGSPRPGTRAARRKVPPPPLGPGPGPRGAFRGGAEAGGAAGFRRPSGGFPRAALPAAGPFGSWRASVLADLCAPVGAPRRPVAVRRPLKGRSGCGAVVRQLQCVRETAGPKCRVLAGSYSACVRGLACCSSSCGGCTFWNGTSTFETVYCSPFPLLCREFIFLMFSQC